LTFINEIKLLKTRRFSFIIKFNVKENRYKAAFPGIILHICEKGKKNAPLTPEQKESNRIKSKVRSRVEHVFGYMTRFMGGIYIRTIGIERAEREICGMNLAYNLKRIAFLVHSKKIPAIS